ncbi:MAG: hypothetical protein ABI132_04645 [Rhodanobacteraceae bacterium]
MLAAKSAAATASKSGKSPRQNAGVMPTEAEKIPLPGKKKSDMKPKRDADKDRQKNKGAQR